MFEVKFHANSAYGGAVVTAAQGGSAFVSPFDCPITGRQVNGQYAYPFSSLLVLSCKYLVFVISMHPQVSYPNVLILFCLLDLSRSRSADMFFRKRASVRRRNSAPTVSITATHALPLMAKMISTWYYSSPSFTSLSLLFTSLLALTQ